MDHDPTDFARSDQADLARVDPDPLQRAPSDDLRSDLDHPEAAKLELADFIRIVKVLFLGGAHGPMVAPPSGVVNTRDEA